MVYTPSEFDERIDVRRVQEVLELAQAAEPLERAKIHRQIRAYMRRMRALVKRERAALKEVSAETLLCEFNSFEEWVNKARSWLGGISGSGVRYKRREKCVCVDAKGRVCHKGADFMRARDEGAFPVKAYRRT